MGGGAWGREWRLCAGGLGHRRRGCVEGHGEREDGVTFGNHLKKKAHVSGREVADRALHTFESILGRDNFERVLGLEHDDAREAHERRVFALLH